METALGQTTMACASLDNSPNEPVEVEDKEMDADYALSVVD